MIGTGDRARPQLADNWNYSLLKTPFEMSLAFDRALKKVIEMLDRPAREKADDVVCVLGWAKETGTIFLQTLTRIELLLCICGSVWGVLLQSPHVDVVPPEPHDLP